LPLKDKELEMLEKDYFDQLYFYLKSNEQRMMLGLNSKDSIREDWISKYDEGAQQRKYSDIARGAERIFYWLLTTIWIPNSSPIGSDLFFETYNAFIHIDTKTANIANPSDFKGKVALSANQTSYEAPFTHTGTPTSVHASLPKYYNAGKDNEKPCLTYIIQIIHNIVSMEIIAVLLISVPNGQLYSVYGDAIVGAGKGKDLSLRYEYKEIPFFKTLDGKQLRVKFLYHNNGTVSKTDITTRTDIT
jgi:hypothetical protein